MGGIIVGNPGGGQYGGGYGGGYPGPPPPIAPPAPPGSQGGGDIYSPGAGTWVGTGQKRRFRPYGPGNPAPASAAPATPTASGGGITPTSYTQVDPALTALQGRYTQYLNTLPNMTNSAITQAAQAARDAAEGGRTALTESAAFRGMNAAPALAQYDATTQEGEQQAIAKEALAGEQMQGQAITSGLPVEQAPTTAALAETSAGIANANLGLQQQEANFNQNLAENQNQFNQYMQVLNASRTSPIYGYGGPGVAGGIYTGMPTSSRYGMGALSYY